MNGKKLSSRRLVHSVANIIMGSKSSLLFIVLFPNGLLRRRWVSILAMASIVVLGFQGLAQADSGPSDPQELEAFIGPLIESHMTESNIPGAVLVLVKDGELLFSKGYGYANLESKTPVYPNTTVFRVMSISKLLTATAIMQLAEKGLIDLQDDISLYLPDGVVDGRYREPITFDQLLTHTAGLDHDTNAIGHSAQDASDLIALSDFVKGNFRQYRSPGVESLYSNGAFNLLGLLVEEISGQPFDDYMDEHILQTLRMEQSSFSQSPSSQDSMAVSYRFENGEYLSQPFFSTHSVPAAGLSSTGMDIAAFMIAHLEGGRFGSATILQHSTVDEMQRQHFTYDPHLPGMAYGFKERLVAGQPRAIWHDGHNAGRVCTMLTLVPEEAFGFFIAYNADDGCVLATDVREQLMNHYYPKGEPVPRQPSPAVSGQLSNQIAGVYRFTNYAHETIVKLLTLEWEDYPRISTPLDSPLEVVFYEGAGDEGRFRYIEVAPLLFKSVNTEGNEESYVWFKEDTTGEIIGFTFDSKFFFERVNWYEHIRLQKGLFLLFGLGFFITLAILLVLRITRRSHDSTPVGKLELWEMRLVATIATANLLFLVLILLALIYRSQLGIEFDTGMPTFLAAVFVLPILTTLLAVVLLFVVGRAWVVNSWSVDRRIAYSLFTVLALAFVPFLQYWNLLGFNW